MSKAMESTKGNGHAAEGIKKSTPTDTPSSDVFAPLNRLVDQLDRQLAAWEIGPGWFGRRLGGMPLVRQSATRDLVWNPAIEVMEENGKFIVRAELPGMKKEDVNVEVIDDEIVIKGKRQQEHEEVSGGYFRSERMYGSFERRIPLPSGVISDGASAQFRDGVLEIKLDSPQRAENARTIAIEG